MKENLQTDDMEPMDKESKDKQPMNKENMYENSLNKESECSKNSKIETRGYAAYAVDAAHGNVKIDRRKSTSGAIFPLLCEAVINQGGIVCGVQYEKIDGKLLVRHGIAETMEAAEAFYGAKYVQSDVGHTFEQIMEALKQRRHVLFSGTACQVAGLRKYLDANQMDALAEELLITVDNICHGVPAPKAWESYVTYCQKIDHKKTLPMFQMRDKSTGWSHYRASVSRTYEDGTHIRERASENPYMRAFMTSLSLQPRCCSCRYKGYHRESDITLGDFWGIWDSHIACDDNRGTSAVLIHSEKAMALWQNLQKAGKLAVCQEVQLEEISRLNRNLLVAAEENPHGAEFLSRLNEQNFGELVEAYAPMKKRTLVQKMMEFIYDCYWRIRLYMNR